MKKCANCKEVKPKTEFHKCCSARDGLNTSCKKCRNDKANSKRIHKIRKPKTQKQTEGVKTCSKCHKTKDVSEFDFQAAGKGGIRSSCKLCRSAEYKGARILKRIPLPTPKEGYKFCSFCKNELPLKDFSKCKSKNSGVMSACKNVELYIIPKIKKILSSSSAIIIRKIGIIALKRE